VADVEKLALSEESQNLGDRKCPGDSEKSFIELPDAKEFLRNRSERVFHQPRLFSTVRLLEEADSANAGDEKMRPPTCLHRTLAGAP
jgi:hypothetical protein